MKIVQKAVVKKDDEFLIVLRAQSLKYFPGCWDFPGGKLEPDEEPFAGVEREVLEETALAVKALEVVHAYDEELDYNGTKIAHRFTLYSTELLSGYVKLNQEHSDFRWATKQQIIQLKLAPCVMRYFQ